jgi:hypothetical protein
VGRKRKRLQNNHKTNESQKQQNPAKVSQAEPVSEKPSANLSSAVWWPELRQMSSLDRSALFGLLSFVFVIYWYTMWPTVAGGDSGELTAAAYTLGIVHPPGYPLFSILGKLFSFIPFGTVGWRINLVSTVFSLGSCYFLYLALFRLTKNTAACVLAVGLFAFSPLVWRYSILAEVFTLNNFFVTALLYFFVRYQEERQAYLVYLMGSLFGLGLTNHHTLVFAGVPLGLYILAQKGSGFLKPVNFLKLFLISIAGLTPYCYLYFASTQTPLIAWGDITSFDGFLKHFLRKEYGTFKLATEGTDKNQLWHGLWYFVESLTVQAMYIGAFFIGTGLYMFLYGDKKQQLGRYFFLFLGIPIGYLVFFHTLANLPFVDGASLYKDIVSRFWIMPGIFFFVFLAIGVNHWSFRVNWPQKAMVALAFVLVTLQMGLHFAHENNHGNYSFAEFGKNLLKPLPKDALFFTLGDINTNTVRYVQQCEGYRTDVKVLDRSLMSYPWLKRIQLKHYPDVVLPGLFYHPQHPLGYNLKKLFDANVGKHEVYLTFLKQKGALESGDKSFDDHYRMSPYGLSFLVKPKSEVFEVDSYMSDSKSYLVTPDEAFPDPPPRASWEEVIYNNYWLAHHLRAVEILKYAMANNFEAKYLKISGSLIEDLIQKRGSAPADYYKNLGISHHHLERQSEGQEKLVHRAEMLKNWREYLKTSKAAESDTYRKIMAIVTAYDRAQMGNKQPASVK